MTVMLEVNKEELAYVMQVAQEALTSYLFSGDIFVPVELVIGLNGLAALHPNNRFRGLANELGTKMLGLHD